MAEFVRAVSELKGGDPLDLETSFSCLINENSLKKVQEHVSDALSHGGKVVCGGELEVGRRLNFKPTIITECRIDMKCVAEETFGPVAPVLRFNTEEEVLSLANTQNSGLAGYIFSDDLKQNTRVAEKLEVGMVGVNEVAILNEMIPFGDIKESGLGREGSIYGINEFLELKLVSIGGLGY